MNEADKLAASMAATIPYCGGPWCGKVEYVTGPVRFRKCFFTDETHTAVEVYELARDHAGRAVYRWLRRETQE